jgi:hypothetical protein
MTTSKHTVHGKVNPCLVREPDFSRLKAGVNDAERKRIALEDMLKVLNSTQNFDKEDERSVEELLLAVMQDEQRCRQELSKRQQLYNETLRVAQLQLQERHEAMCHLNDTSDAFSLFPELAKKFAQRQALMIQRVSEATDKLEAI